MTVMLYIYAASQTGGTETLMLVSLYLMPIVWLTSIITTIVIAIIKKRILLNRQMIKWTTLTILFATPIPLLFLIKLIGFFIKL